MLVALVDLHLLHCVVAVVAQLELLVQEARLCTQLGIVFVRSEAIDEL